MEAHKVLADAGFDVTSYGVGTCVRLPGPNRFEPNVYEFGTPYKAILADLRSKPAKDQPHYERLGLISMLERNLKIKEAPEKWQNADLADTDVVVTFEETIMDALVEDMQQRMPGDLHPVLVVNLEVTDNNREALAAAPQVSLQSSSDEVDVRTVWHLQGSLLFDVLASALLLCHYSQARYHRLLLTRLDAMHADRMCRAETFNLWSTLCDVRAGVETGADAGGGRGLDGWRA